MNPFEFSNLLILQSFPVNPFAHWQVKELIPSSHAPLFKQGFDLQSSISKFINDKSCHFLIIKIFEYKRMGHAFSAYLFHSRFLRNQQDRYICKKQFRLHMFHHCHRDSLCSHQYLSIIKMLLSTTIVFSISLNDRIKLLYMQFIWNWNVTYATVVPFETMRTFTSVRVYTVVTYAVIQTWRALTIINIWKYVSWLVNCLYSFNSWLQWSWNYQHTMLAVSSVEPHGAKTFVGTDSIFTCSSVVTRVSITIIYV